jgi:hypothetical protein
LRAGFPAAFVVRQLLAQVRDLPVDESLIVPKPASAEGSCAKRHVTPRSGVRPKLNKIDACR